MKRIKNIYKSACLMGLLAVCTTSCEEWLTIYPTDRVVEENFWEDKNDLEGVRFGIYKQMANTVEKFAIWGDLRSDSYNLNTIDHKDQDHRNTYNEIMKGMPDSSMIVFDWGEVYKTINYCNKVLQHGEEVQKKDHQFTRTEWDYMKSEVTALRALNYFYLIRAFKDVPYTTKVVNTDAEVESFGLTNQLVVLDSIIVDCERVKGKARNRFNSNTDTKGLITNSAIYAMLADMYLWRASLHHGRLGENGTDDVVIVNPDGTTNTVTHTVKGDYQLAADYADDAMKTLANQFKEQSSVSSSFTNETVTYGLENVNLIKNKFEGAAQSITPQLEAAEDIFATGNSIESIFEIQYSQSDNRKNPVINSLYGNNNGTHLMISEDALGECYGAWMNDQCKYDTRIWAGAQNLITSSATAGSATSLAGYYCIKYKNPLPVFTGTGSNRELKFMYTSSSGNDYRNWIIYRLTDVMLIKAEALACLKNNNKEVQKICNAIRRRSYCNYNDASMIPSENAATQDPKDKGECNAYPTSDYVRMVMNERQIELLGEGKRWFDLVRYAERNSYSSTDERDVREPDYGNGQSGVSKMVEEYLKNAYQNYYTTLKNRFKNRYGLYCPIYYMEVKASNGAIEQNPVWNHSKYQQ